MTDRIPAWRRVLIAADLDKAADALTADANDLGGRFAPEHHGAVRGRKLAAANDVRAYAERVRAGQGDMTTQEFKQAETMAKAANCNGILTDSPVPYRGFAENDDSYGANLEHWAEGNATKNSLVDSGDMTRVAGHGQIPFFALSSYGGATWEEAGRAGPPQDDAIGVQLQQEQERAREAAHEAVAQRTEGKSWTAAMQDSGLDEVRQPDKYTLQDRSEQDPNRPTTNRTQAEQAAWDEIGQAEIEQEHARVQQQADTRADGDVMEA